MTPRIGFDDYSIAHRALSPVDTLDFAEEFGLEGVQFLEPSRIDPELDPGRLSAFRETAGGRGLYLEVGLPSPNPARWSRILGRAVTAADHARELQRHVQGAAALGCRHARVYLGDRHDRFRDDPPWPSQISASVEVLQALAPCLKAHGLRVAIETHADLTCVELLRVVEKLGPEVAGVTLDTGNLLMRLDDPVRAAGRLAPWVLSTHVKDCVLAKTERGLCWQARAVGSGMLPLPDVLAPLLRANPSLNLSIELHPRIYDLPIHDRSWLAFFPDLEPADLAAVRQFAEGCESQYQAGAIERPEAVEAVSWQERDLNWLASSVGYLRRVLPALLPPDRADAYPRVARQS